MATEGRRAIRICGISGYAGDPPGHMRRNLEAGEVDALIGDYLAEFNLAINVIARAQGKHPGWEPTFMEGTRQSLDLLARRRIKLVTNGGAINPRGAAEEIQKWCDDAQNGLKVAYVTGDDVVQDVRRQIADGSLRHLDGVNTNVGQGNESQKSVQALRKHDIIAANAYLGSRGIRAALDRGADIVVCGRVADASPVVGLASWWHGWRDDEWDALAGALVTGHLIECSGYATGGNFSGFEGADPKQLIDIGMPIAEIATDGTAVITKHDSLPGVVTREVVACQFLYELQGDVYLNSDVTALLRDIAIDDCGKDRVQVTGIRGTPPPPTTKVACFYLAGYQAEYMIAMTGSNNRAKAELFRRQVAHRLQGVDGILVHDVQEYGRPERNASTQFAGTSFLRIFVQCTTAEAVARVMQAHLSIGLEHFSGYHSTLMTNPTQAVPRPFLGYFPGLFDQKDIRQTVGFIKGDRQSIDIPPPPDTQAIAKINSFDPPQRDASSRGGDEVEIELGDIALARSGDKGGNINIGLFPRSEKSNAKGLPSTAQWAWLRDTLTRKKMRELIGDDWRDDYSIERCEFPNLRAVHFVVYGILGRGVTSSPVLDNLGKGFADWIRSRHIKAPLALCSKL